MSKNGPVNRFIDFFTISGIIDKWIECFPTSELDNEISEAFPTKGEFILKEFNPYILVSPLSTRVLSRTALAGLNPTQLRKMTSNFSALKGLSKDMHNTISSNAEANTLFPFDCDSNGNFNKIQEVSEASNDAIEIFNVIIEFLMGAPYNTRTGKAISRPKIEDLDYNYIGIMYMILEIILEERFNNTLGLPMLDDHKQFEKEIADVCELLGGTAGNTAIAAIDTAISPIIRLPQEVKKLLSVLISITARKLGEYAAHRFHEEFTERFKGSQFPDITKFPRYEKTVKSTPDIIQKQR